MRRFDVLRTLLLPVVIGGLLLSGSWRDAPTSAQPVLANGRISLPGRRRPASPILLIRCVSMRCRATSTRVRSWRRA